MNSPEGYQYQVLTDREKRESIIRRGVKLVELVKNDAYETLLFIDRSSRPAAWIFDAFWHKKYPEEPTPDILFINTGKKDLRGKYMYGIGQAVSLDAGMMFVGIYDDEENIELFKKRVAGDEQTKRQIFDEMGQEAAESLRGKKVLVVDDFECEGVQELFVMTIIGEIYKPKSIDYFEWQDEDLPPHGLSYEVGETSFVAHPKEDKDTRETIERVKHEIVMLSQMLTPTVR